MAQKVSIVLVDDIDGSEAEETVSFALDGRDYEIDLNSVFREKDPDDLGKLTFTASSDPALGVAITGSTAKITGLAAQVLNPTLTFTAKDPAGATGTTTATFALKGAPPPVNTPPTLTFT